MTTTGKRARRKFGTRFAAKRSKARPRKPERKRFGALPFSHREGKGNAPDAAVAANEQLVRRAYEVRRRYGVDPEDASVSVIQQTSGGW